MTRYTEAELIAMDVDTLDQLAFGCKGGDVLTLEPKRIEILYPGDLDNPTHRFEQEGMAWVNQVDLTSPIEVSVNDSGEFCLEDGHHRWFAASKLNKQLQASVTIKGNSVQAILNRQALQPEFTPPTQQEITTILKRHPLIKLKESVQAAYLVGSFARGNAHGASDVDVLLKVDPRPGMTESELDDAYRRLIQAHFMKHNIRGKADAVHPQWMGRRVDVYFTYDEPTGERPAVTLLKSRPKP